MVKVEFEQVVVFVCVLFSGVFIVIVGFCGGVGFYFCQFFLYVRYIFDVVFMNNIRRVVLVMYVSGY